MLFRKILDIFSLKNKDNNTSKEKFLELFEISSAPNLKQVINDLNRTNKLIVNKKDNATQEILPVSSVTSLNERNKKFNDENINSFLSNLTNNNTVMNNYLASNLHQGGFKNLAEKLLSEYFLGEYLFEIGDKVATFTVEEDGSLLYEEQFDIQGIRDFHKPSETALLQEEGRTLATLKLKTRIKLNENNVIEHLPMGGLEVEVKDKAALIFFEDPRGRFHQFLSWLKEMIQTLLSKFTRGFEKQPEKNLQDFPAVRKKL